MRRRPALFALALAIATPPASAAPMGPDTEAVAVLLIEADPDQDVAAKAMTNALRQRILDSAEYTLNGTSDPLIVMAHAAGCSLKGWKRPLAQASEHVFDPACLQRVGAELRARRFFWGLAYAEGGTTFVRLHLWQEGKTDRVATLPYDATQRDRLADRLYRKLVTPNAVGDLKLAGGPVGELFVDGKPAGTYGDGVELTIETGEHVLEVRDGPRVLARGRTRIEPGGRSQARLTPVAETTPPPSQAPDHDPPPITVRPRPSAWPWVLGGVGVAGLAGAGAFWGLRSSERSDLKEACAGRACLADQGDAAKRVNTYATLSAVSLGVGVAAGAGLAAYLLAPRRGAAPVSGAVVPLAGGVGAGVVGSF
jgi:hypothetical protein